MIPIGPEVYGALRRVFAEPVAETSVVSTISLLRFRDDNEMQRSSGFVRH